MPKSASLRLDDLRAIHELVGECRELGDAASLWQGHFAAGLAGMIDADMIGCGEVTDLLADDLPRILGMTEWGWENGFNVDGWRESCRLFESHPDLAFNPTFRKYLGRVKDGADGECQSRTDLTDDRDWYRAWAYEHIVRVIGADHCMWCFRGLSLSPGDHFGLTPGRAAGRPDFSTREKAIVREAIASIGKLIGGPLARFEEPSPTDLPLRLREVLRCLLEGDADKQVASRLGISRMTVNSHTKSLYRHFGVQSRAELLARWVRRGWGLHAAWSTTKTPSM